jgi:pilus assembly protein CpaC
MSRLQLLVLILVILLMRISFGRVLELGQAYPIPPRTSKVWVEKSSVLKVETKGGRLQLAAKQSGSTQVRLNEKVELFQVLHPDQIALFEEFNQRVQKLPGLSVSLEEGEVVVEGYLHSWETWKTLASGIQNPQYKMRAQFASELKGKIQDHINIELKSQGLLSVNLIMGPSLEVRLNPQQPSLERYQNFFQKLGVKVVIAPDTLELVPIIRVDITVVELKKKASHKIGVQWPNQASFHVLPGEIVSADNFIATIQALEESGEAKTLASPNIICRSGKEAEFLAGGEIPITIMNFRMQDIVWKRYGVYMKIKPIADSSGRISLSVETEVSTLDNRSKEGVPSLFTNRVSSHFDLNRSQVVALSGLLQEHSDQSLAGLPGLSQLPMIGPLFSSRDFQNKKTELVIFVRPRLLESENQIEIQSGASHVRASL